MLFAFTLVEMHVILPSYVNDFLIMASGKYMLQQKYTIPIGAIFSGVLDIKIFKNIDTYIGSNNY